MRNRFIFAYTRLQARHGMRPDESVWQLVESHRDIANYIQAARNTVLHQWVAGVQPSGDAHLLEEALLEQYRVYVRDIAVFVPKTWSRAVRWIESLTFLPSIHYLLTGNTAYGWMLENPTLRKFTVADQAQRLNILAQTQFAPLVTGMEAGKPLTIAWLDYWQSLWPEKISQRSPLSKLVSVLLNHIEEFSQLSPAITWAQRKKLSEILVYMFRNHAFESVSVFVHLLLVALDIERLRAGIMRRRLFPDYKGETQ